MCVCLRVYLFINADCIYRTACHKAFATKQKAIIIGSLGNSCRCGWCRVCVWISHVVTCSVWNIVQISCLSSRSINVLFILNAFFFLSFSLSLHVQLFLAFTSLLFGRFIIGSLNVKTNNCVPGFHLAYGWCVGALKAFRSTRNN